MTKPNDESISPFISGLVKLDAHLAAARQLAIGSQVVAKPGCDLQHCGTRGTLLAIDAAGVATVEVTMTRVGPTGLAYTAGKLRHPMPADQLQPYRPPTYAEMQAARAADDGSVPF